MSVGTLVGALAQDLFHQGTDYREGLDVAVVVDRSLVIGLQVEGVDDIGIVKNRLNALGIPAKLHYPIEGYPHDVDLIVSDDGYGKNEFVETTRPLVVVTAPGPGSGLPRNRSTRRKTSSS